MEGIGIIGCGARMNEVVKQLFKVNPENKIAGVYDPSEKSVENFLNKFGREIIIYKNYLDLLKNPDIEWILIGSINSAHKDQIINSLKFGKNVFSEKPLAISEEECFEIKKEFDSKNLIFLISYPLRYSIHYLEIKKIIDSGKIGKIISMEFNEVLEFDHGAFIMTDWRRLQKNSGGHLLEKCCHDLDLARWFIESLPKKVASFGGLNCFMEKNSEIYDEIKKRENRKILFDEKEIPNPFKSDKDIVDNQIVIIEYENEVRATFHTNCNSGIPERRMYICGTKGTLRADLVSGIIEFREFGSNKKIEVINVKEENDGHGGGDINLARELDSAINMKIKPKTSMIDAIVSAISAIKIDEARIKEKIIYLDSTWEKFGIK
ncbi:MAG: Gfo/Idh/MocA family oxidoreductase [Candidatus Pacearchaeota archaeon]